MTYSKTINSLSVSDAFLVRSLASTVKDVRVVTSAPVATAQRIKRIRQELQPTFPIHKQALIIDEGVGDKSYCLFYMLITKSQVSNSYRSLISISQSVPYVFISCQLGLKKTLTSRTCKPPKRKTGWDSK